MNQETRYIPPTESAAAQPALRLAATRFPWLSVVFALLYGVSPIDLLPDLIPLIGQLDDGMILTIALFLVGRWWFKRRSEGRIHPVSR